MIDSIYPDYIILKIHGANSADPDGGTSCDPPYLDIRNLQI